MSDRVRENYQDFLIMLSGHEMNIHRLNIICLESIDETNNSI